MFDEITKKYVEVAIGAEEQTPKKQIKKTRRFSGSTYKNSKERILAIKEKYKYGVTQEILDEFIKSL